MNIKEAQAEILKFPQVSAVHVTLQTITYTTIDEIYIYDWNDDNLRFRIGPARVRIRGNKSRTQAGVILPRTVKIYDPSFESAKPIPHPNVHPYGGSACLGGETYTAIQAALTHQEYTAAVDATLHFIQKYSTDWYVSFLQLTLQNPGRTEFLKDGQWISKSRR